MPPVRRSKRTSRLGTSAAPAASPQPSRKRARSQAVAGETSNNENEKPKEQTSELITRSTAEKRATLREMLKTIYSMDFPDDFFDIYDIAAAISPGEPLRAFERLLDITLAGPYEAVAKLESSKSSAADTISASNELLIAGRFYYDPPEVITVLIGSQGSGEHWGYFRDNPKELPTYVVYSGSSSSPMFTIAGKSMFWPLHERFLLRKTPAMDEEDAETFQKLVSKFVKDYSVKTLQKLRIARDRQCIARTTSKLGIVVPYNKQTTVGYRDLEVSQSKFPSFLEDVRAIKQQNADAKPIHGMKQALKKYDSMLTYANIANDECDFGTSLQLGLNLWAGGAEFQKDAVAILQVAYQLLNRSGFIKILKAHASARSDQQLR